MTSSKGEMAQVFRHAAAEVTRRGLARGMRVNSQGEVCALGALDLVMGTRNWDMALCKVLDAALDLARDTREDPYNVDKLRTGATMPAYRVARWSNLSAGAAEVAGGFLKAAEMLEEEELKAEAAWRAWERQAEAEREEKELVGA